MRRQDMTERSDGATRRPVRRRDPWAHAADVATVVAAAALVGWLLWSVLWLYGVLP
jgi:hypothetical protein